MSKDVQRLFNVVVSLERIHCTLVMVVGLNSHSLEEGDPVMAAEDTKDIPEAVEDWRYQYEPCYMLRKERPSRTQSFVVADILEVSRRKDFEMGDRALHTLHRPSFGAAVRGIDISKMRSNGTTKRLERLTCRC